MTEQELIHPAVAPKLRDGIMVCNKKCRNGHDFDDDDEETSLPSLCVATKSKQACKPYYHLLAQGASAPAPEVPVRYPVAIAIDADGNPSVVANDGTMWFRYECEWHQFPPLPQPEAETNDE